MVLSLPVRHGKSEYCSVVLPSWFLTLFPDKRVVMASHSHSLAGHFGSRVRSIVRDFGPALTGASLYPGQSARDDFRMEEGGGLFATSPGASCAGRGGDLVIADDLVKDFQKASSPTARRALALWFHGELIARKQPNAKVICVMSRRHPSDLTGELEEMNPELPPSERWHVIRQPALDEQGNALWPEMWPADALQAKKKQYEAAGLEYVWEAEYQQNPTGDLASLEWPKEYFDHILCDGSAWMAGARKQMRVLAVDPSKGSKDDTGDYSGFADVTVDERRHLWCFPRLVRLTSSEVEDWVISMCKATHYDAVLIESNGHGQTICDNVLVKAKAEGMVIPLHRHPSKIDKVVRIRMGLTPLLQQKRIHVDSRSPQAKLFVSQLQEFPTGQHDDGPDALNLACDLINHLLRAKPQPQRERLTA